MANSPLPVIDLFAGPGGLGEGFSAFRQSDGSNSFRVRLSIEKDPFAHETLTLRSFVRQFENPPDEYYKALSDTDRSLADRIKNLYAAHSKEAMAANEEAWNAELGKESNTAVWDKIKKALGSSEKWVLIGGPPCQAYSLAGRSRNKGIKRYEPDKDHRQFLYVEYLQVIADHQPVAFVMENVKGLLSATVHNRRIFDRILDDLRDPVGALRREGRNARTGRRGNPAVHYEIFSLTDRRPFDHACLQDYIVRMERFGIPQARHRLILLGVRRDFAGDSIPSILPEKKPIFANRVLRGLPRIRSGLSRRVDTPEDWVDVIHDIENKKWFKELADDKLYSQMIKKLDDLGAPQKDRGNEFVSYQAQIDYAPEWFLDARLPGVLNHSTRTHIASDLARYFFVACFGLAHKRSPTLSDFPKALLPQHQNVPDALNGGNFTDRFRVQLSNRPATTVTSHISKDGHYYIHPDPTQCRSLTVREAARIQTFPDNYFFCGPRTSQYRQVGNAVPPLLAKQIAEVVYRILNC